MGEFHAPGAIPASQVAQGEESSNRQAQAVLAYFRANPAARLTPHEVHDVVGADWPLTSTRRAMTDLTGQGFLVKDDVGGKDGPYGTFNSVWGLRPA